MYPTIRHIDDVLPHIKGKPEFAVKDNGYGLVAIDYNYVDKDTFDSPITRECRGIKFCASTGNILARPLHKFFNIGERPETQFKEVAAVGIDTVMDKMDGSMVHPVILDGEVRLCTRAGITDISRDAEKLVDFWMAAWMRTTLWSGWTPIFEYISPNNRIVIEYEKPDLILLATRHTSSGIYDRNFTVFCGKPLPCGYDVVEQYYPDNFCPDKTRKETGHEGYVLSLLNGERVKIKTDEYVALHRARGDTERAHDLLRLILEGKLDDLLPLLDVERQRQARDLQSVVWAMVGRWQNIIEDVQIRCALSTRREYADEVKSDIPLILQGVAFSTFDNGGVREAIVDRLLHVSKNLSRTREMFAVLTTEEEWAAIFLIL